MNAYIMLALSLVCAVSSQLLFKLGLQTIGGLSRGSFDAWQVVRMISNWQILIGLAIYVVGWLSWMAVLSRLELSFVYPFTSLNYVLVSLLSWAILGETVSPVRSLGIAVICLGVFIASRG